MSKEKQLPEKMLSIDGRIMNLTYNATQNMLTANGYTSLAGNIYFTGIRISENLQIVKSIGIGYAHTFLNKLVIWTNINGEKIKIGSKNFYCKIYNEVNIKKEAILMVVDKLKTEAKKDSTIFEEKDLFAFAEKMIENTYQNPIETMKSIQLQKLLIKN